MPLKKWLSNLKPFKKTQHHNMKIYNSLLNVIAYILPTAVNNYNDFDPDTFDPDTFDPMNLGDNATGNGAPMRVSKPKTLANFTVTIANASASTQNVELFNYLRTYTEVTNTTLNAYNVFNGDLSAAGATIVTGQNTLYFNTNGNLLQKSSANALEVTITCKQIPYRALLKASGLFSFQVDSTKLSYSLDATLDQDLSIFQNTFLGKLTSNAVTPRTYFKDNQFQSKQVTIPLKYTIDAERGISLQVLAGETLTLNFFVSGYNKINMQ